MKLETFFEKFELFADAPDAVGKMRKLILQLAVQGRLKSKDVDFGFPKVRLDSLGDWAQGCGFPVAEQGHADLPILFSKVSDMNLPGNEREILKTNHTIDEEAAKRLRVKVHPPGTVIFPKIGGAIATNKRRVLVRPTAIDNNCSGIIPNKLCSTHWLFLVLSAIDFAEYQSGTSVPAVNQGALGEIEVALPPLAEQKRIVAKVDELMVLCDRLEAQQRERDTRHAVLARASLTRFADAPTPANLNLLFHQSYAISPLELRRLILSSAFLGILSSADPRDESASDLIAHISLKNERSQRIAKKLMLDPVSPDCYPSTVPSHWALARFHSIAEIASNLVNPRDFSGFRHLAPDNVGKGNGLLLRCATVQEDQVTSSNHRFYSGQIIYSKIRPNLSKVVIVDFDGLCSADMYPINARIDVRYLHKFMLSDFFLAQAIKTDTRVAMPKINQDELNAITVPIPPLAEQRRIVAKVDQLMALVDQLEAQLATASTTAAQLLDALVAELTGTVRRAPGRVEPQLDQGDIATPDDPPSASEPTTSASNAGRAGDRPSRDGARPSRDGEPSATDAATLLALLRERGSLSSSEAQSATGLDPATLRGHFKALIDQGLARTVGQRRGMRYLSSKNVVDG